MKYYIKETLPGGDRQKNARGKARADVEGILDQAGYQPIALSLPFQARHLRPVYRQRERDRLVSRLI